MTTTIYRDPFVLGTPTQSDFKPGMRLTEMVERMPYLPPDFALSGEIRIDGHKIPRAVWGLVKPKSTAHDIPIIVTFHAAIRGGGGGDEGGKSGLALVAMIAITVAAVAVSGGVLAEPGALFISSSLVAGSTGAIVASAAISIIGGLVITALTPPPSPLRSSDGPGFDRDSRGAASASGNILEPGGPLPRVIGTRKVFPPLIGEPFVFYEGENEIVEAIFALAGPHDLSDIRIGGITIEDSEDISFETREGWPDDAPLTIAQQQTRTDPVRIELSTHTVQPEEQDRLVSTSSVDLPLFHGTSTKTAPDEVLLHLSFFGGLSKDSLVTDAIRVAFRIRIRKAGDVPWRNLPELHFEHASLRQIRATIRLVFQVGEGPAFPSVPIFGAFVEARKLSPGQTDEPATSAWAADAYFSTGSGDDYLARGTEGTTKVKNVTLTDSSATFYLDTASFAEGVYEIEIKRGCAFLADSYTKATYFYNGGLKDFFAWRDVDGDAVIAETRENIIDAVHLVRSVSIWNEAPVQKSGFALVAVRAVNRRIDQLSILASGYVRDWDGSGFNNWVTTSNPAPHFNDVLTGDLNLDPLPPTLIDTASLTDWRTASTTLDYTCDHIAEGSRVSDVLDILGGCGFARRYQSELWGVTRDLDRAGEDPVQIFSPRNSSGFKWARAMARLPDGLRVNFQSDDVDFTPDQLIVFRDDIPGPRLEQITYEGINSESKILRRARFDLAQAKLRSTIYTLIAPAEAIVVRRGSLVGVNHDVLQSQTGFARIDSVQTSGGNVDGITLDSEVEVWTEGDMNSVADMNTIADMRLIGRKSGVAIRRTNGETTVHPLSNATGSTSILTFTTPVTDSTTTGGPFDGGTIPQIDVGCLVVVGNTGLEFIRLLVTSVSPAPDLMAQIELVDEAPGLWSLGAGFAEWVLGDGIFFAPGDQMKWE